MVIFHSYVTNYQRVTHVKQKGRGCKKTIPIVIIWLWVKTLVPGWYTNIAGKWIAIPPNIVMIGFEYVIIKHHFMYA